MQTTSNMLARQQEDVPGVGAAGATASPGSRLGWRQRLPRWRAARRQERLQGLDARWNAHHEQVQARTLDGPLDYVTRTRPSLGLVINAMRM